MKVFRILALSIICFTLSGVIAPKNRPTIRVSRQESATTISASLFHFFDLGIKRIYTDILWIQTLLESDLEHYKGSDENSWMFQRFNTIALLDPKFIENYLYGGQYLSVIKDDDIGARVLFEKGLATYPDHLHLLYYAGSHYLIELNDKENALKCYEKIYYDPKTPAHIRLIVSRLKAEAGYLEESLRLMQQLYEDAPPDTPLKRAYKERLYSIKTEVDLQCLNNEQLSENPAQTERHVSSQVRAVSSEAPYPASKKCPRVDLFGDPYIKRNGVYHAPREWKKFQIHSKKAK